MTPYLPRLIVASLLVAASLLPAPAAETDAHQARVARLLALNMPLRHLNREPLGDRVATNALGNLLNSLDPERVYFLASDVAGFDPEKTKLDDQLKGGDIAFAFKVYNLFQNRVANRVAFVKELLEKGVDLTTTNTYTWKRRDAAWPDGEEAWNELWRRKITHEYLGRVVAKQLGEEDALAGLDDEEDSATNSARAAEAKLPPEAQIRKNYERFQTIIQDNDANWVLERYLNAFTHAYDPHTDYMSPLSEEDFQIGMKLSLQGIGALLATSEDGAARVERLITGGPAERDGRLKSGDRIIAVGQGDEEPVDVLHWPLSKTVRLIRGEKGSRVVLRVIPAADTTGASVTSVDLLRDEVKLEEQAAKSDSRIVPGADGIERRIGVITLPEFYADMKSGRTEEARSCARDVRRLVEGLRGEGVDGIVLDLRNNGGGSLTDAIQMTGLFIPSGPVVQVQDLKRVHTLSDPDPDVLYEGPLVVLVNRLSASASEILAGALQDYGRAIIVGDAKTHGKGTVQTLMTLSNASTNAGSLKVTTASFFRIAGGSTQLRGVEPDIVLPSPLDAMEVGEDQLPNAMPWTKVDPAFYDVSPELEAFRPLLRTASEERRGSNERFSAYTNLLARLAERQQATEISLNLETRVELARSEKALQESLKDKTPETGDEEKKKPDLVLEESLQIICDWISLRESPPVETTASHKG